MEETKVAVTTGTAKKSCLDLYKLPATKVLCKTAKLCLAAFLRYPEYNSDEQK